MTLRVVNGANEPVPLGELTIRYWFTRDGEQDLKHWCDYATIGAGKVRATFHRIAKPAKHADTWLEIAFANDAGMVKENGDSGEVQSRSALSDWANFDQANDYSFDPKAADWTDAPRITLYRKGALVWGVEPPIAIKPTAP
jgi:hypothetical protein